MSSPSAINHARKAQKNMLPIHAETCPHYLYLLSSALGPTELDHDQHSHSHSEEEIWSGAQNVCAPPLRHSTTDLSSLWNSINNSTITVVSSDHAPSRYNHPDGKQKPLFLAKQSGRPPTFNNIPNGLPGLETRLPLLFSAATTPSLTSPGGAYATLSLPKFVSLTSTTPARMYGLSHRKGSIAPGLDADLVIWYPGSHPRAKTVIRNENLHHSIDYTPFEGMTVGNWPRYVILRGSVAWDRDGGGIVGNAGRGQYLKRTKGEVVVGKAEGFGMEVNGLGGNEEQLVPVGMKKGERALWM